MNSFKELLPVDCLQNQPAQPIITHTISNIISVESKEQALVLDVLSSHSWHITIPAHAEIINPVVIPHLISYDQNHVIEKLVISVGAYSQVIFNDSLLNAVVHIKEVVLYLEPYAHVTWYGDYKTIINSSHGVYCTVVLQEKAQFISSILVDTKGITECKVAVEMHGQHAQSHVQIGSITNGNATAFIETLQNHTVHTTHSAVKVKQLAYDQSQSYYKSSIDIASAAKQTSAHQKHHALILSKSARVFANPQLNVHQNKEVHCMHGSAISHLNDVALWYLMARGIDHSSARSLLIEGFFSDMDATIKKGISNVYIK